MNKFRKCRCEDASTLSEDPLNCCTGFNEDTTGALCGVGWVCIGTKRSDPTERDRSRASIFVKRRPSDRCASIIIAIAILWVSYCNRRYF